MTAGGWSNLKRALASGLAIVVLTACGSTGTGASTETPAAAAGTTPNALSLVNCPPTGQGPTGGSLTGLGASIGAFADTHQPVDRQYNGEFGQVWSGQVNKDLHEFSTRCTQSGYVGSVTHNLGSPATADQAKASITHDLAPSDAKQTDDKVFGPCELVFYKSATLATVLGMNDPDGTFVVELGSTTNNGGGYNASDVESLLYDYDVSGGC